MNNNQKLWWKQAKSDHDLFVEHRKRGMPQCHCLHYLQMATEKLGKAYLWRTGNAPPRTHYGFVQFMRLLGQIRRADQERIANLFSFRRFRDFQSRINTLLTTAYAFQALAPALASDGPNPEYPWPHSQPQFAPVEHDFQVWTTLQTSQGRDLIRIIRIAIERFPQYADV